MPRLVVAHSQPSACIVQQDVVPSATFSKCGRTTSDNVQTIENERRHKRPREQARPKLALQSHGVTGQADGI